MISLRHLWRPQSEAVATPFTPALTRVREMRDDAYWKPVTDPSQIQERAERVSQVRDQIHIPQLAGERETNNRKIESLRVWLIIRAPVLLGIAVLFVCLLLLILMLYLGED